MEKKLLYNILAVLFCYGVGVVIHYLIFYFDCIGGILCGVNGDIPDIVFNMWLNDNIILFTGEYFWPFIKTLSIYTLAGGFFMVPIVLILAFIFEDNDRLCNNIFRGVLFLFLVVTIFFFCRAFGFTIPNLPDEPIKDGYSITYFVSVTHLILLHCATLIADFYILYLIIFKPNFLNDWIK